MVYLGIPMNLWLVWFESRNCFKSSRTFVGMGGAVAVQARLGHERGHRLRLCRAHHPEGRHHLRSRLQRRPRPASLRDVDHDVLGPSHLQLHLALSHCLVLCPHDLEAVPWKLLLRPQATVAVFVGWLSLYARHGRGSRGRWKDDHDCKSTSTSSISSLCFTKSPTSLSLSCFSLELGLCT